MIAPQLAAQSQRSIYSHELLQHRPGYGSSHSKVCESQHRVDDLQPISFPSSWKGVVAAYCTQRFGGQIIMVRLLLHLLFPFTSAYPADDLAMVGILLDTVIYTML